MMKTSFALFAAALFSLSAHAQTAAPAAPAKSGAPAAVVTPAATSCEARAVSSSGKPLTGAAKTSFIKKCEGGGSAAAACETRAIDKNGKPLAGAAKTSFMKKCEADAAK